MSNQAIVARLGAMADDVELGQTDVATFTSEFFGHIQALDRIPYSHLKEAQLARAQLCQAIEQGQEALVDVHALGDWLRGWLAKVPSGSIHS